MKECYKNIYSILSNEKQDYANFNFLRQIKEIIDIKVDYYNNNDLSNVLNILDNFYLNNNFFSYDIQVNEIPYQFIYNYENIFKKKYKIQRNNSNPQIVMSKYNINQFKYKKIKNEKCIRTKKGAMCSII